MSHRVQTTHIQGLIRNGLDIAQKCDGMTDNDYIDVARDDLEHKPRTGLALEKAAADLRHAAEELTAERLSLLNMKQV